MASYKKVTISKRKTKSGNLTQYTVKGGVSTYHRPIKTYNYSTARNIAAARRRVVKKHKARAAKRRKR